MVWYNTVPQTAFYRTDRPVPQLQIVRAQVAWVHVAHHWCHCPRAPTFGHASILHKAASREDIWVTVQTQCKREISERTPPFHWAENNSVNRAVASCVQRGDLSDATCTTLIGCFFLFLRRFLWPLVFQALVCWVKPCETQHWSCGLSSYLLVVFTSARLMCFAEAS